MSRGRKTPSVVAGPADFAARLMGRRLRNIAAAVLGLLLVLTGETTSGAAATPAAFSTMVFFGDSLTAGYGLDNPLADSYPGVIQQKIEAAHLPWHVINAGLSGETSAGGLRRIDWVLRQPVDIFFLALGANDGLRGIDPAVTAKNLGEIIDHVRAKYPAARIVVAGMQMPRSMGDAYTKDYDAVFAQVAAEKHATLVPFLLAGVGGHPELNQADGIHPNPAGARIVAENVWKVLRSLL